MFILAWYVVRDKGMNQLNQFAIRSEVFGIHHLGPYAGY